MKTVGLGLLVRNALRTQSHPNWSVNEVSSATNTRARGQPLILALDAIHICWTAPRSCQGPSGLARARSSPQ
jgi:hypothetical protein